MAFQTSVLRDGAWVTETVDLRAVLKGQNAEPRDSTRQAPLKPPSCGLLTRTLVESARANLILPVRLRSANNNDIAYVGDHFVQIYELRSDGRLKDVIRKNDFGCRIRNACVVGLPVIPELKEDPSADSSSAPYFKTEGGHGGSFGFSQTRQLPAGMQLPPQMLMVSLENGDSVFLFVQLGPDGRPGFVGSHFSTPAHLKLGFHLAVDPSSRYIVAAGPMNHIGVYEIESHAQMSERYLNNEPIRPIRSFRFLDARSVIHKLTFLYPRQGDDHHIILVLVVVKNGKSRTVLYEWEVGNDLKTVFSEDKRGHRMPDEFQMPLLLVPLRVQSAFVAITEDAMAVCTECLHGPPRFQPIPLPDPPVTDHHRGRRQPLWTAWSRPFRLPSYSKSRDCFYLAREDGMVCFLDAEEETNVSSTIAIGPFPCTISSAFACVFDHSTDVLFLGSDAGPGGYFRLPPRKPFERVGRVPNWSPVVDFTTTDESAGSHQDAHPDKSVVSWQQARYRKPDRIFATCEGGEGRGTITEYRYGLRADIGLDLDYGPGIKEAWLMEFSSLTFNGYLLLLSMPDATAALLVRHDFSSAAAPEPGRIPFDLTSTTLALARSVRLAIQVTRKNIVLAVQHRVVSHPCETLQGLSHATVSDACVVHDCIAVSAHTDSQFQIHVFKVDHDHLTLAHALTLDVDGEVTCLSLGADYTLLAGIRTNSTTFLGHGSLREPLSELRLINLTEDVSDTDGALGLPSSPALEGIESIAKVRDTVILGTRSGEVILVEEKAGSVSISCEKFGTTAASIRHGHRAGKPDPAILVTCDHALVSIRLHRRGGRNDDAARIAAKHRVWPVDASRLEAPSPPMHFVTVVDIPSEDGVTPVLMVSGSRLLLAEVHDEPGLVPRSIPLFGTPNRVMYCQFMQCLIVAIYDRTGPNLVLVNPDTGDDIGKAVDKLKQPQVCISGLGRADDRILGLAEWNYRREGNVWNFLLVATRGGRLIVVATEKFAARDGSPQMYRYWTRFRKQVKEPVYSVLGYDEGVIYCAGSTIYWEVLDLVEKRLKPLKSCELASPATGLRLSHGKLLAMTSGDSLLAVDHVSRPGADWEDPAGLCHVDPWKRNGVDFIEVAGPAGPDEPAGASAITLVADRDGGVAGLWVPWQTPQRECEVVFEAELPSSVRRFRRGKTRPLWEQQQQQQQQQRRWRRRRRGGGQAPEPHGPMYGRLPATADDAEILGVSLDGSMRQFTLLSVEAWRLLRFLQNLALASQEVCPFSAYAWPRPRVGDDEGGVDGVEVDPEPKLDRGLEMHVDGDILQRCVSRRALERVVARPAHRARLVELLGELDGGEHTEGLAAEGGHAAYFGLAYDILEYYLSPSF